MPEKLPFDLAVFDLDGTLVRRDLTIAPESLDKLFHLQARGLKTTVATGRMLKAALPYIRQARVTLPVILYNGSIVLDPGSRDVLYERRIPCAQARIALQLAKAFPIDPQLYVHPSDEEFFVSHLSPNARAFSAKDGIQPKVVGDLEAFLEADPLKLLIIGERPQLLRFRAQVIERKLDLSTVLSEHDFLEILPAGSSKGTALVHLCTRLGLSLERVVAFGDNPNDAEMLSVAGLGVAMGSGAQELKENADLVVDSVAEGLQRIFG